MSGYDYMNRSGYGRGYGTRSYVTKVETYEEIRRPRVVEYKYPASPLIVEYPKEAKSIDPYGRPPEVDNLINQILTEVNGPPIRIPELDPGTTRGRRIPVRVEGVDDFRANPRYVSSPTEGYKNGSPPIIAEIPSEYGAPIHPSGRSPSHAYDRLPQRDYSYPNNPRGSSLHSDYDHSPQRNYYPSNNRWDGSRNHEVPSNHWGSSPKSPTLDYGVSDDHGVPGDHLAKPKAQQVYGVPGDHLAKPQARQGYGVPGDYPAKPQAQQSYGVPGDYPAKPQAQQGYKVPGDYPVKPQAQQGYGVPNPPSPLKPETFKGGSPVKPDSVRDYGAPKNQWGSSPKKSEFRRDVEVPWKPESPRDHRTLDNQWSNSPKKSHPLGNHGFGNNQWDRSSSPDNNHHSKKQSPLKSETPKDYVAPRNQLSNPPIYSPKSREYGVPIYTPSSPGPGYDHPPNNLSLKKPEVWQDHGVPNSQYDGSPMRKPTHRDYGVPGSQRPSSPVYNAQPPPVTYEDGLHTSDNKPKVTNHPYGEPKANSHNYPASKGTGYSDGLHNDHGNDGWRSNPYSDDHQPKQAHTPHGKVANDIGEAVGQLTLADGASAKGVVGRPGFTVPPPIRTKPEMSRVTTDIDVGRLQGSMVVLMLPRSHISTRKTKNRP